MISEKSTQTLELPKILEQLVKHTTFSAGAELARTLHPTTIIDQAVTWQQETAEARLLTENKVNFTLGGARDVREPAVQATRGIMIEAQVMLDIRQTLRRGTTVKRTVGRMKGSYPLLSDIANQIEECTDLQDAIGRVLNEKGEILDTASPQLAIIRRDLKVAYDKLQTRLMRLVGSTTNAQFLQESIITTRNGRYVIPIKAEFKGRIPGIVHDSSSSGATLFIEPLATVELNNTYRELQLNEEKEIRRILQELTDEVGHESERIVRTVEVLGYLDLVFAKAHYAEELKATEPILFPFRTRPNNPAHPGSTIYLKAARHPLLKGNVMPIDVEFDEATWVLVVTGPNTGGKTVAIKTIGLLTLMAQCGLQVPAEEAKLSVFEGVYADIGDEQSIEQSLSTFSSHMTNTISILRECDNKSLVLLDELGAGTDPAEGSALARAILTHLVDRQVTTVVTTHHPELKIYGVETPGVRNASVEFDLSTLRPTYRLIIGLPGRSNALAIATRLGLSDEIIESARSMVTTEDLVADDLLDEIQRTREEIRRDRSLIAALREEIEEQQAELQSRLDKIEDERRNVVATARRQADEEIKTFQREVKRLRNEMRSASLPLDMLKQVQDEAAALAANAQETVPNEVETVVENTWAPKLGETVWLAKLNAEGTITELESNSATIQVGTLRVRAGLDEITHRTRSEKREMKRGHQRQYEKSPDPVAPKGQSPGLELDLRGERVDEALRRLETYVDAAYMSGLPFARIIHGKGTGALKKAVRERVEQHALISKVTEALPQEGGGGVTIIHMVPIT
ncbi:MAG: endonuclease MutS2 [Chloroflexi bacterium]|nr:endonuclease MutS2 [Chloroflexota bacterium]MCC6895963.1 endonuclease MutS2 [Anaerolineae bacterium]